jgi:coenzyme F420-reducing hydrogenase gamma subunit
MKKAPRSRRLVARALGACAWTGAVQGFASEKVNHDARREGP